MSPLDQISLQVTASLRTWVTPVLASESSLMGTSLQNKAYGQALPFLFTLCLPLLFFLVC